MLTTPGAKELIYAYNTGVHRHYTSIRYVLQSYAYIIGLPES